MHCIDLPDWAVERGRAINAFDAIDPARTALVAVDMQNVFLAPGEVFGNQHALDIIPAVNRLAAAMRGAGGTVIWTRQTVSHATPLAMPAWQYDLSIPHVRRAVETMLAGTNSHALHPAMAIAREDVVLDKYRYSAFLCPARALAAALEQRHIEMLVIAGTLTNVCCESTARDGNMLGYQVIMASDAAAAATDAEHNAALLNLRLNFADVRSTAEICAMLEGR
ncbi:MAG: cysteine hydrolase [Pseudomonadota bacterium]